MKTKDQYQIYEAARKRTKQKKRLYFHFVLFLVGSVFFIVLNKFLNVYPEYDWFVWAITLWLFFLILNILNVFVFNRFFGNDWERIETEKLVVKHENKVDKLEKKLEKKGVFSSKSAIEEKASN